MGLFDHFSIFEVFIWVLGKSSRNHTHAHILTEIQWSYWIRKRSLQLPTGVF